MATVAALRDLAAQLEQTLRSAGTPERAAQEQAYLKSSLTFLGASVPDTRRAVRAFMAEHRELTGPDVRRLAAVLWDEPVFERRSAAVMLLTADAGRSTADDLALVERFVRDSRTWALVDPLATKIG